MGLRVECGIKIWAHSQVVSELRPITGRGKCASVENDRHGHAKFGKENVGVGCLILYFCEPLYVNSIYISRYGYGTFIRDQLPIFIDICQASHPGLAT